jgi:hypothetical protein
MSNNSFTKNPVLYLEEALILKLKLPSASVKPVTNQGCIDETIA